MFSCIAKSERGLLSTGDEVFYQAISLKDNYQRMLCHFGDNVPASIAGSLWQARQAKNNHSAQSGMTVWRTDEGFCFELANLDTENNLPVICYVTHDEIILQGEKPSLLLMETWNSLMLRDHITARTTPELLYLLLLDLYSRLCPGVNGFNDANLLLLKKELMALTLWLKEESKKYGALCEAQYDNLYRLMLV